MTNRISRSFFIILLGCAIATTTGCAGVSQKDAGPTQEPHTTTPAGPQAEAPLPEEVLEAFPEHRPADAVPFNGHYYKVFEVTDPELTWRQKKALCERMGGYLAVIETPEEQAFIAKLANDRYLSLGASDQAVEGQWRWVNGAPWDETYWMEGQPNDYAAEEHFLATFDDGLWVDVAASGWDWWLPSGFICEWEE